MPESYVLVHRIVKIKYEPKFQSAWHNHDFFHAIFILSGAGVIRCQDTSYRVSTDEFYMIPPGMYHDIASEDSRDFKTIEIKFDVADRRLYTAACALPTLIHAGGTSLRTTLENIISEAESHHPYYSQVINSIFAVEVFRLLRGMDEMRQRTQMNVNAELFKHKSSDSLWLSGIIEYIQKHLSQQITLAALAAHAGVSPSYLSSRFKQRYGVSIAKYISTNRISKAKEMMCRNDMSISQISEALGFSSLHYFSKFFKKLEGMPPSAYVSRMQNDIRIDIHDYYISN